MATDEAEGCRVLREDRLRAHEYLDRWLLHAEREADDGWLHGRSGYVGTFKLEAHAADAADGGLQLTIERSFVEAL